MKGFLPALLVWQGSQSAIDDTTPATEMLDLAVDPLAPIAQRMSVERKLRVRFASAALLGRLGHTSPLVLPKVYAAAKQIAIVNSVVNARKCNITNSIQHYIIYILRARSSAVRAGDS